MAGNLVVDIVGDISQLAQSMSDAQSITDKGIAALMSKVNELNKAIADGGQQVKAGADIASDASRQRIAGIDAEIAKYKELKEANKQSVSDPSALAEQNKAHDEHIAKLTAEKSAIAEADKAQAAATASADKLLRSLQLQNIAITDGAAAAAAYKVALAGGTSAQQDMAAKLATANQLWRDAAKETAASAQSLAAEALANKAAKESLDAYMVSLQRNSILAREGVGAAAAFDVARRGGNAALQAEASAMALAAESARSHGHELTSLADITLTSRAKTELLTEAHELLMGQTKRAAGSLMVLGEQTGIMSLVMTSTGATILGVMAVMGGLGAAAISAARQQEELQRGLAGTGNFAGASVTSMNQLAAVIAKAGQVSIGNAKEISFAMAESGKYSAEMIRTIGTTIAEFSSKTGQDIEKVTKNMEAIFENPLAGSKRLNESLHYLNASQMEYIESLMRAGKVEEARSFAFERIKDNADQINVKLGILAQSWKGVGMAASAAGDMMKQALVNGLEKIGLVNAPVDKVIANKIKDAQSRIDTLKSNDNIKSLWGAAPLANGPDPEIAQLEAKIKLLQGMSSTMKDNSAQKAAQKQQDAADNESMTRVIDAHLAHRKDTVLITERLTAAQNELNKAMAPGALAKYASGSGDPNLSPEERLAKLQQSLKDEVEYQKAALAKATAPAKGSNDSYLAAQKEQQGIIDQAREGLKAYDEAVKENLNSGAISYKEYYAGIVAATQSAYKVIADAEKQQISNAQGNAKPGFNKQEAMQQYTNNLTKSVIEGSLLQNKAIDDSAKKAEDSTRKMDEFIEAERAASLAKTGSYLEAELAKEAKKQDEFNKLKIGMDKDTIAQRQSILDEANAARQQVATGMDLKAQTAADLADLQSQLDAFKSANPGGALGQLWIDQTTAQLTHASAAKIIADMQAQIDNASNAKDHNLLQKQLDDFNASMKKLDTKSFTDLTKVIGEDLAGAFGKVGASMSGVFDSFTRFTEFQDAISQKQQKAIEDAQALAAAQIKAAEHSARASGNDDPAAAAKATAQIQQDLAKKTEAINKQAADESARAQISSYASMAGSAKSFFSENSAGYKVLSGIEKAAHLASLAMTLESMATKLFATTTVTTAAIAGDQATAASATSGSLVEIAATGAVNAVKALGAVINQGNGDPYTAFGRIAAMAAIMGALGYAVSGGGGGGSNQSAADTFKAAGAGSGLGTEADSSAKADSISKSLADLKGNSDISLIHTSGMLAALRDIDSNISGLANVLIRTGSITGLSAGIQTGFTENAIGKSVASFGASLDKALGGGILPGIFSSIGSALGKLFGSTTKITDTGFTQNNGGKQQTIGDVSQVGFDISGYRNTETNNKFFGISTGSSSGHDLMPVGTDVSNQFAGIVKNVAAGVTAAADAFGIGGKAFQDTLAGIAVKIDDITVQGKTAAEIQQELADVFGKMADQITGKAIPGYESLTKVGEGYFETVTRLATEYEYTNQVAAKLGLDTSAAFGAVGVASMTARDNLINLAGGVNNLQGVVDSYYTAMYSQQDQNKETTRELTAAFANMKDPVTGLALQLPTTIDGYKQLTTAMGNAGPEFQSNYLTLLQLGPAYAKLTQSQKDLAKAASDAGNSQAAFVSKYSATGSGDALTQAQAQTDIVSAFKDPSLAGDVIPKTAQEWADLMASLDKTTPSGQAAISALNGLQNAIDVTTTKAKAAASSATDLQASLFQKYSGGDTSLTDAKAQSDIATAFAGHENLIPKTAAQLADLVAHFDPLNEADQRFLQSLNGLTGAFDTVFNAATRANAAISTAGSNQAAMVSKYSNTGSGAALTQSAAKFDISALFATDPALAGVAIPKTKQELADLVGSFDKTTLAGQRLIQEFKGVDGAFDTVLSAADKAKAAADSATATQASLYAKYASYGSDSLTLANAQAQINEQFTKYGEKIPENKDQLAALIKSIDTTTASGQGAVEVLNKLSPAFDTIFGQAGKLATAAGLGGDTIKNAFVNAINTQNTAGNPAASGKALADGVIGGVYSAMQNSLGGQVQDIMLKGVVNPILESLSKGATLSEAVSSVSFAATAEAAKKAIKNMADLFNSPEWKDLMTQLGGLFKDVGQYGQGVGQYVPTPITPPPAATTPQVDPMIAFMQGLNRTFADLTAPNNYQKAINGINNTYEDSKKQLQDLISQQTGVTEAAKLQTMAENSTAMAMIEKIRVEQLNQAREQQNIVLKGYDIKLLQAQGQAYAATMAQRELDIANIKKTDGDYAALQQQKINRATDDANTQKLQVELMGLMGGAEQALGITRYNELQALSPVDQAIKKQIYAYQDLQSAMTAATNGINALKGLLSAQGNTQSALNLGVMAAQGDAASALDKAGASFGMGAGGMAAWLKATGQSLEQAAVSYWSAMTTAQQVAVTNAITAKTQLISAWQAGYDAQLKVVNGFKAGLDALDGLSKTIRDDIASIQIDQGTMTPTQWADQQIAESKAKLMTLYGQGASPTDLVAEGNNLATLTMSRYNAEKTAITDLMTYTKQLSDYAKGLLTGNLSPLSMKAKLDEAMTQYQDTLKKANAGDKDAQGKVTGLADTLLGLGHDYYASSQGYTDIFNQVQADLKKAGADTLTDAQRQTQYLATLAGNATQTINELKLLQDGVAVIKKEIKPQFDTAVKSLGDIATALGANGVSVASLVAALPHDIAVALQASMAATAPSSTVLATTSPGVGDPAQKSGGGGQGAPTAASIVGNLSATSSTADINAALQKAAGAGISAADLAAQWSHANPSNKISSDDLIAYAKSAGVPLMAQGGITNGPVIAGEAGAEAVVPLSGGRSIPVSIDFARFGRQDSAPLVAEVKALREEVALLRAERKQGDAENIRQRGQIAQETIERQDVTNDHLRRQGVDAATR